MIITSILPVLTAKKWYFSDLVSALSVNLKYFKKKKSKFPPFPPLVPVKSPQEIEEKNEKSF
jgi:hypothetical protein